MRYLFLCIVVFLMTLLLVIVEVEAKIDPYIAFSLRQAQEEFKSLSNSDNQINNLGGITRLAGMVYDKDREDLIIVGQAVEGARKITIDDLVVALRALYVHDSAPLVSIDRTAKTYNTGKQAIRFEGGIENTQFGSDLLQADIVLKKLALGKLPTDIWGFQSYFDMLSEYAKQGEGEDSINSLFWFYPPEGNILAVRNDVFVIHDVRVAVATQVTGINGKLVAQVDNVRDELSDQFSYHLTTHYDDLSVAYPEVGRLKALFDLTALSRGIQSLPTRPNIDYWVHQHKVASVLTPTEYPLLSRNKDVTASGGVRTVELDGGIQLKALILRLQDGDVTALREAVLLSRPRKTSVSWPVPINAWQIPGTTDYTQLTTDQEDLIEKALYQKIGVTVESRIFNQADYSKIQGMLSNSPPVATPKIDYPTFGSTSTMPRSHTTDKVGGVMLSGVASLVGSGSAKVDLSGGNFSFIVDGKNARLAPEAFRKFITALWTVYYSNQDPGISIDPIAPGVDKHLVRYIGKVVNTDLGRVMRDADYLMKKWSVGTERPDIPGFKNPDDYAAEKRVLYLAASRFWFIPEDMKFKRSDDMLLFDDGRMTIQTEYLTTSAKKSADPANEKFADFFTEHYPEISDKYPVYKELFEYAKMVSLAKYLKEQGIPLFWFLMANKDLVLTEDSPGTVDELVKGSDYFRDITISGGVNLDFDAEDQDHYVYDQAAIDAINKARSKYVSDTQSTTDISPDKKITQIGPDPFSFDLGKESYTVVPQHSLTSGKDRRGIRYQTDMALRGRGLQLTQQSLDILKADLVYRETMEEMEPVLKTMEKHNLDQEEIYALYQVKKKKAEKRVEGILGGLNKIKNKKYSDKNEFITALELSIGTEQTERLKHQISKVSYYSTNLELVRYFNPKKRGSGEFGNGWRLLVPYSIKPSGKTKTEFSNRIIPVKMALVNLLTGEEEILTFSTERYSNAGYVPERLENSQIVGLFMYTDGSYRLADKLGNEFRFNPRGSLTDMVFSKDNHIQYEYLDGFTDAFEQAPYSIEPHGEERTPFLNVIIPKRMKLKDHVHGGTEILTFSDKGDFAGYVPVNGQKSRFKIMAMMSDASFRLIDKNGNETALTSSGKFDKMAVSDDRPMVSAVSQGNHRITFKYTIDNSGNVLIASANLSEGEAEKPTFIVKYKYDEEGRLADITKTNNRTARKQDIQRTTAFAGNH